jgi:hypothetical protein
MQQFTFGGDTVTARYDLADGNDFGFATEANPSISGVSGTVTFIEDGAAVSIAPSAVVFDPDTAVFNGGSVVVSYISGSDPFDILFVRNIGSGAGEIGVSGANVQYEGVTFGTISGGNAGSSLTITFTTDGNATQAAVQALLRALAYNITTDNPGLTNDLVILLDDGTGGVGAALVDVNVTPVNDAPVLQTSPKPSLGSVAEDTPTASVPGIAVSSILGGVSDPDGPSSLQGIAVIDLTEKFLGIWQYSLDGGANWLPMGTPSESAALLLAPTDLVRFVPNANYNGTPQLKFRAWDQSNSLAAGSVVSVVGQTGGTAAYSHAFVSAKLTVTAVNDAPLLQTSPQPALGTVTQDTPAASVPGIPVSTIIGGITDSDAGAAKGIAVIDLTERFLGTWQYSTDGGANWLPIGDPTDSQALLLAPTDLVRFVPNPGYYGTPQLKFRAWDQSNNLAGGTVVDTAGQTGGTGAYSTAAVSAKLTVNRNPSMTLSGTVGYVADSPAITLAPNALVTDDGPDFAGGQLNVSITTGASTSNLLQLSGDFTVDGSNNVLHNATIIGTLNPDGGEETTDLIVTFNSSADAAVVQALIRSIKFSTIGGPAGTRSIVFSLTDGDGGVSESRTKTVNVT